MGLKKTHLLLANGPNLSLLGLRQPTLYGHDTLSEIAKQVEMRCSNQDVQCSHYQTNCEGELVSWLGHWYKKGVSGEIALAGLVINGAGLSHTSVILADAVALFHEAGVPIVEVHISNIYRREKFRHHSYISSYATAVVTGMGSYGYLVATDFVLKRLPLGG